MTNHADLYATGLDLWTRWIEMWNGRPELALELAAPRFTLHLPTPSLVDAATVDSREAVVRWVTEHRARYQRLVFDAGSGPFVDTRACVVAGPWHADASIDGTPRPVCGMDTIAFRDGKITEYWTIAREVDQVGKWSTLARSSGRTELTLPSVESGIQHREHGEVG